MAVQGSSPPQAHPPPIPPGVDPMIAGYLQQFSIWCRNGFAAKLNATQALPGVLMQANDALPGTTPAVFHVQVNSAGTVTATQVKTGSGQP